MTSPSHVLVVRELFGKTGGPGKRMYAHTYRSVPLRCVIYISLSLSFSAQIRPEASRLPRARRLITSNVKYHRKCRVTHASLLFTIHYPSMSASRQVRVHARQMSAAACIIRRYQARSSRLSCIINENFCPAAAVRRVTFISTLPRLNPNCAFS